jgi:hypothetical protein
LEVTLSARALTILSKEFYLLVYKSVKPVVSLVLEEYDTFLFGL